MELRDATAIVTGGAGTIGGAIAAALAQAGARVALMDLPGEALAKSAARLRQHGHRVVAAEVDVADEASVAQAIARVEAELGPAQVLVNAAGRQRAVGPLWEVDPRSWQADVNVNLFGTFLCCRAVAPSMRRRGQGYIVNLSGAGSDKPYPFISAYCCSKAAVVRLTESLAEELKSQGVRVFCVVPGAVRSAITQHLATCPEGRKWIPNAEADINHWEPAELTAQVVLKLLSGELDALSGRTFSSAVDLNNLAASADRLIQEDRLMLRMRPAE
jgi:3-oxoacyl-[acyl-carrier protein] reductase